MKPRLNPETEHLDVHVTDWNAYEAASREIHMLWIQATRTLLYASLMQSDGSYIITPQVVSALRDAMATAYDDLDDEGKTYCRNALLPVALALWDGTP